MTDDAKLRRQLRARIQARHADIEVFLAHTRPRRNVLTNVTIVCSALAAAFTAGPAVAGPPGVYAVAEGIGVKPGAVWQSLCTAAFIVAVLAAIAANLHRTHDLPAQVTAAETCCTDLENLLTSLEFRDLPVTEAVELYQQYNSHIPFVRERAPQPKMAAPH